MACQGDKEEETILSKLVKNDDWSPNPVSRLYQYQGFWYPGMSIGGVLKAQEQDPSELKLSPSDILLCSSPKTGTTWIKSLAFSIVSRSRFDPCSQDHPLLTTFPHDLIPYIETHKPRDPELPLLSTHMPYTALPMSVLGGTCKIVYISRNPKDAFVSLWHFIQKIVSQKESATVVPLEKAFDLFCRGISAYGPYWDHVLEYWKASLDHPERVLLLKYEDMMEDAEPHVRRLAEFISHPFSEEEERDGIPRRIVDMCSFGSLSQLEMNKADSSDTISVSKSILFRKAKVKDWTNCW